MRGRRTGSTWIWWVFLIVLVVALFFGGIAVLIAVDKHYACFRAMLVHFLEADNHFDGGLWFSAAATFAGALISAVPGLMCGLLAYIQTERLHELEDRYHRPGLELDEAKVSIIVLRNGKGDMLKRWEEIRDGLPWNEYRYRRCAEEAIDKQHPLYIVLRMCFHVKNEVTVKHISVTQVDFLIGEETLKWVLTGRKSEKTRYKIWEFEKQIEQGETKYTLEGILCPLKENGTADFWYAMRGFALHEDIRDSERRDLELNVHMNVEYEYSARSGAECMLRVEFDVNKMQQTRVVQENCSCNGYFTFDIKRDRFFRTRKWYPPKRTGGI